MDFVKIREFTRKFWAVILVFLIAFSVRVFYISQKSGLHVDESLSYIISSVNKYGWRDSIPAGTEYTGHELLNLTFGNPSSIKETFKDVGKMYIDTRDSSWPNLYYTCLRIFSAAADDYELKSLIARGCALNLLFFTLSFFYFFKLLQILFKDEDKQKYIPFALFIAYMNTGAISNTLYIRPYQLQEAMLVIMTYIFAIFYNDIKNNKCNLPPKKIILTALVMSVVSLSGYFCLVYECLLGIVLLYMCFKNKDYKTAGKFMLIFILNIVFANLLYLRFIFGVNAPRAAEVCYNVSINSENIKLSSQRIITLLTRFLFYPAIIILTIISATVQKNKKEINRLLLVISGAAFVWCLTIMYLAPYKILRYIMPIFPLMTLVLAEFVQRVNFKISYVYAGLYLWAAIFASSLDYGAPRPEKIIPFSAPVENVFRRADEQFSFRYKPEITVFINEAKPWTAASLFPYVNTSQTYKFVDFAFLENKLYPENSFIVFPQEKSLPEEETFQKLDCGLYYKCFETGD